MTALRLTSTVKHISLGLFRYESNVSLSVLDVYYGADQPQPNGAKLYALRIIRSIALRHRASRNSSGYSNCNNSCTLLRISARVNGQKVLQRRLSYGKRIAIVLMQRVWQFSITIMCQRIHMNKRESSSYRLHCLCLVLLIAFICTFINPIYKSIRFCT